MRYIVAALALGLVAALQASFFSRVSLGGAAPQLVLLSVVAWSLARGPVEGIFWGFAGGLLYDFASGGPVGVSALAMVAVATVAGSFGRRMFGTNPLLPMLTVFASTVVYFVIVSFLLATLHYPTEWLAVMTDVALPAAIANSLLGLLICPLFLFVATHTSRQLRVEF